MYEKMSTWPQKIKNEEKHVPKNKIFPIHENYFDRKMYNVDIPNLLHQE